MAGDGTAATDRFWVRFWGVRGSIPIPGTGTVRYGGNTSCVELGCGKHRLVIDAGTGIRALGRKLDAAAHPVEVTLLLTHYHWDHLIGLPYFVPLHRDDSLVRFCGPKLGDWGPEEALRNLMRSPFHPVSFDSLPCERQIRVVVPGESFTVGGSGDDEVRVEAFPVLHPDQALAYAVTYRDTRYVHATDIECTASETKRLVEFARGANLLCLDAAFTREAYEGLDGQPSRLGWGHSTWEQAVQVAASANVKALVLFHHWDEHDDDALDRIAAAAAARFPRTTTAREGLVMDLA